MRPFVLLIAMTTFVSVNALADDLQPGSKDPAAMAIVSRALAALEPAGTSPELVDVKALGMLTAFGTRSATMPLTLEAKGTTKTRAVLQQKAGMSIGITNGYDGVVHRPDGKDVTVNTLNLTSDRESFIPALSLLADAQSSSATVALSKTANTNGTNDDAIDISLSRSTDIKDATIEIGLTKTTFYINRTTGFVDLVQLTHYPEDGGSNLQIQLVLGNYQQISGFAVPLLQRTYVDNHIESQVQLQSVEFNAELPDSDFDLGAKQ